jgi:hypothetical protein
MRAIRRCVAIFAVLGALTAFAQTQYGTPAPPRPASNAQAETGCPWLTEGSAAHMLGGDVSVSVTATNKDDGTCRFSRRSEPRGVLEIAVARQPQQVCSARSMKLKGIGNEATRCSLRAPHGQAAEMISSRVRDLFFTVVSRMPAKKAVKSVNLQEDGLEQIAEQVAGNLY